MRSEKKGVLINDFDGVYNIGSTNAYLHVINSVLSQCDIVMDPSITRARVMEEWGTPPREIMSGVVKSQVSENRFQIVNKKALRLYRELMILDFPQMIEPVPGGAATLEGLKEDYDLALNTSADKDILFGIVMPKLGIDPKVFKEELVWTADNTPAEHVKPSSYVIDKVLEKTKHSRNRAAMIGDSGSDVVSAYLGGIEPIVPLTGNLTAALADDLHVTYIIEDVTKVSEVLDRVIGRTALQPYLM